MFPLGRESVFPSVFPLGRVSAYPFGLVSVFPSVFPLGRVSVYPFGRVSVLALGLLLKPGR